MRWEKTCKYSQFLGIEFSSMYRIRNMNRVELLFSVILIITRIQQSLGSPA